ncbi:Harmonin [Stylophora pistillata]|uniref:Harmonin n=1 Tax=Stylophora pistillata TaxID=50429 RepID=A0A2B4SNH5_STYPI|nr:Harmonin [Stylophora pistillata]
MGDSICLISKEIISNSPEKLVSELKSVINTPKRYPLFREVRHVIKPTDATTYQNLIPKSPSDGIRLIKMQHFGNNATGFSVRGGKEHGVGIFVSLVSRGSQADIVGLKAGDEILSINGLYLGEATHGEVVNILRSHSNLLLKVRSKEGLFIISVTSGSLADKTGARAVYLLKSFKELQLVLRHSKEAEKFILDEILKQQQDALPEFAIKTQLLTRKAEEKERLEKAKGQMHFNQLLRSKEIDEEGKEKGNNSLEEKAGNETDKFKEESLSSSQPACKSSEVNMTPNSEKRAAFSETLKFEDDVLEGREAHFLSIEKVSELGLELEERDGGIFVTEVQEHGCVAVHGGVCTGDQLLNVEGTSLLGVTVLQAHEELNKAMNRNSENIDLVVAISLKRGNRRPILRTGSVVRKRDPITGAEVQSP